MGPDLPHRAKQVKREERGPKKWVLGLWPTLLKLDVKVAPRTSPTEAARLMAYDGQVSTFVTREQPVEHLDKTDAHSIDLYITADYMQ